MASSSDVDTPLLNCISPLYGTSLEMPPILRLPGTASLANLFSGVGHLGSITGAAANFMPTPQGPLSFKSTGMSLCVGTLDVQGGLTVTGKTLFLGGFDGITSMWKLETGAYSITSKGRLNFQTAEQARIISTTTTIQSKITTLRGRVFVDGLGDLAATVNAKKGFDIPHPNKENHRLRHICVEGPESAVYIRGKLENENIIKLPDYWDGLVDLETITVNLTQIGHSQDLMVDEIEDGKVIKIKSGNQQTIHCYYQVWADRLGEKLIVEYEGQTPDDYPGDSSEYSIAGWNYDKRR